MTTEQDVLVVMTMCQVVSLVEPAELMGYIKSINTQLSSTYGHSNTLSPKQMVLFHCSTCGLYVASMWPV